MRVLLDEDVPRQLKRDLMGHDVATVREMHWNGIINGDLLRLAASRFDVLLTCDRNMQYHQNLSAIGLALVVVAAPRNTIVAIRPLAPEILRVLSAGVQPGTVTVVGHCRIC